MTLERSSKERRNVFMDEDKGGKSSRSCRVLTDTSAQKGIGERLGSLIQLVRNRRHSVIEGMQRLSVGEKRLVDDECARASWDLIVSKLWCQGGCQHARDRGRDG